MHHCTNLENMHFIILHFATVSALLASAYLKNVSNASSVFLALRSRQVWSNSQDKSVIKSGVIQVCVCSLLYVCESALLTFQYSGEQLKLLAESEEGCGSISPLIH